MRLPVPLAAALASLCVVNWSAITKGAPFAMAAQTADALSTTPSKKSEAIPWDQLGAKAGADYHGEGLSVAATEAGARLHCVFQRLDGEATAEGLWLVSTVTNPPGGRFRVVATTVGRQRLSSRGTVTVTGQTVRFARPGLVEEYSVSPDGVRQDFVVTEKPGDDSPLKVRLAVTGAWVEPATYGAQLVLEKSGRKIVYSRLHATDANGKELPARLDAEQNSETCLAVVVNDAGAVYPVRIDPTFSDANWISMGGPTTGADGNVNAAVVDDSGNLYIGGTFTVVGNVLANNIARWDGSSWSALASGMDNGVLALAVSGGTLYAGGYFTNAGGHAASNIARWDGSSWSALGSGMDRYGYVYALAVSGGTLYAGGTFTTVGGTPANFIAQWNGSSWSALWSGMNGAVYALAVSGGTLYAGGTFTTVGGTPANFIAQWNGSSWSALGSGMNGAVYALAVSDGTLYAGGAFTTAGGNAANNIAQWNGSSWSVLGSGLGPPGVNALAVSGGMLYVGGSFTNAGGHAASCIAQWDGSSWSALGSGMNPYGYVEALAVSDGTLYAGGSFTNAGGHAASCIAQWDGSSWSALGSGMNPYGYVQALTVSGGTLYAGGSFTKAGGTRPNTLRNGMGAVGRR